MEQPKDDGPMADGAMGVAEAVKFTGLSRPELYKQMAAGRLAYSKVGRRRLIPKRSLVTLLSEGLVTAGGRP